MLLENIGRFHRVEKYNLHINNYMGVYELVPVLKYMRAYNTTCNPTVNSFNNLIFFF